MKAKEQTMSSCGRVRHRSKGSPLLVAAAISSGMGLLGCTGVPVDGTSTRLFNERYAHAAPSPRRTLGTTALPPAAGIPAETAPTFRTLEDWVRYALEHNPRITSAVAHYEAAVQQVPQVTALPDPRISYRHFLESVETRVGAQQFAIGLSQPLPWLGKLRLQGEMASQAAQAAAARVSVVQNAIIAEVAKAWYELYYFDRALQIMRGNRDLVRYLERIARTRYGSGSSGHPDVIRAQVELGKLENDLASFTDREAPLRARLNATLNRAPEAAIERPERAPVVEVTPQDEAIISRVATNNPVLQATGFTIAKAKAAKERARKDFLPDFSFGIDYIATDDARAPNIAGSGNDPVTAGFTMTLPIQRKKYRAGVEAADAQIAGELARRDQQLNQLQAETVDALFRLRDAERQLELYQATLLPKAKESLLATQRAYSAGESSFADLIDVQRALLVFELAEVRAVTDHHLARTTLEALMGEPLAALAVPQPHPQERMNEQ